MGQDLSVRLSVGLRLVLSKEAYGSGWWLLLPVDVVTLLTLTRWMAAAPLFCAQPMAPQQWQSIKPLSGKGSSPQLHQPNGHSHDNSGRQPWRCMMLEAQCSYSSPSPRFLSDTQSRPGLF